ncbi:hypothetical protein BKA56DRAFT_679438 [Ilyonectria sp. MPI-CAGE-AT-0026]|nr:hypothetical protein BKA56DRAFT_679438 [Ilyonectria sp. MPI-CAGE-AT-0026]
MAISFRNVKACLSSRPWVVFEEAFLHDPSLELQDLTYPDISAYVKTHFEANSGFKALKRMEPEFAAILMQNLANKSSGVFLWVRLVVKSLLSGLSNFDRVSDLQRRLDAFPSDLEGFYQNMFDSIDPFYAESANKYFCLVDIAGGKLTALGLCFADEVETESFEAGLEFSALALSAEETEYRYEQTRRRLNSHCKGFLEIPDYDYEAVMAPNGTLDNIAPPPPPPHLLRHPPPPPPPHLRKVRLLPGSLRPPPPPPSFPPHLRKVTYLHRTVRDFLKSREIDQKIRSNTGSFDSLFSLMWSNLQMIRAWEFESRIYNQLPGLVRDTMEYAVSAERLGKLNHVLLNALEKVMDSRFKSDARCIGNEGSNSSHWATACGPVQENRVRSKPPETFLELASLHPLHGYVLARITQNVNIFLDEDERPLLDRIVTQYEEYPAFQELKFSDDAFPCVPNREIIQYCLRSGNDPNYVRDERTIWQNILQQCMQMSTQRHGISDSGILSQLKSRMEHWSSIVELFILADADPRMNRNSPLGSMVRDAFGILLPNRSKYLEKLISRKKKRWSLLGKFITPPIKREVHTYKDITPITVLNRQTGVKTNTTWGELFKARIVTDLEQEMRAMSVADGMIPRDAVEELEVPDGLEYEMEDYELASASGGWAYPGGRVSRGQASRERDSQGRRGD